jgi:hypothetical protein
MYSEAGTRKTSTPGGGESIVKQHFNQADAFRIANLRANQLPREGEDYKGENMTIGQWLGHSDERNLPESSKWKHTSDNYHM